MTVDHVYLTKILVIFDSCPKIDNGLKAMSFLLYASIIIYFYHILPNKPQDVEKDPLLFNLPIAPDPCFIISQGSS